MSCLIKPIAPDDLATLAIFAAENFALNFGHLYLPEHLNHHIEKTCSAAFFESELASGANILGAFEGEQLVGYIKCGAMGLPIPHGKDDREIHRCYVAVSHQNQRLGRRLFEAALALPQIASAPSVFLGVWEENLIAQKLYKSLGFEPVGKYFYEVGPHRDQEIIMQKKETID